MSFLGIRKSGGDGGFEALCRGTRLIKRLENCKTNLTPFSHRYRMILSGKRWIRAKAN